MSPLLSSNASTASSDEAKPVATPSEPAGDARATEVDDDSVTTTDSRIALREFHEWVIQTVLDSAMALDPPLLDPKARDAVNTYTRSLRNDLSENSASTASVKASHSRDQVRQSHLRALKDLVPGTQVGPCESLIWRQLFHWRETFVADSIVTQNRYVPHWVAAAT